MTDKTAEQMRRKALADAIEKGVDLSSLIALHDKILIWHRSWVDYQAADSLFYDTARTLSDGDDEALTMENLKTLKTSKRDAETGRTTWGNCNEWLHAYSKRFDK